MTDLYDMDGPNKRALRCGLCGEQIGVMFGDEPSDPSKVRSRCTMCGAVEEAEAILDSENSV